MSAHDEMLAKASACDFMMTNPYLLARASQCWSEMADFRRERQRAKRFTYGDQWGDLVTTDRGRISEEEYIRSQGNMPLKNNLIRRLVRNVLGVFRNQWQPPLVRARDEMESTHATLMQKLLWYNIERNRMEEVYARTMEEFLISGMAIHRKWYGNKGDACDCWTDFVSPDKFFIDRTSRDFRNWDTDLVGQLHDMTFAALCAAFATSANDVKILHKIYGNQAEKCRVIEVWTREYLCYYYCHDPLTGEFFKIDISEYDDIVRAENARRRRLPHKVPCIRSEWHIDREWHYTFLSPEGHVLASGISPYKHGQHPFVIKAYPFIDGEIHSFVSDIIDQQKYTNRLISMYDWILRASAKGVLLFPESAMPPGVNIEDIADEWSRFNGVLIYRPRPGDPLPQQISSNSSNIGISELLNIQLKMMEDISGVNGALQGKLDSGAISGTLYSQQTRNSLTALTDLLRTFNDFILEATAMDADNIRQFYSPAIINSIAGTQTNLKDTSTFYDTRFDFTFTAGNADDEPEVPHASASGPNAHKSQSSQSTRDPASPG